MVIFNSRHYLKKANTQTIVKQHHTERTPLQLQIRIVETLTRYKIHIHETKNDYLTILMQVPVRI